MARAIVTYSRGWHALAMTRSLGRQGIEVYCGEEAPFAPCFFSKYCTGSFQYPSVADDPEGFIDFLVEKVKELKPPDDEPYVLMPVHKETWLIAKHRERFEPYINVPLTSLENMEQTHDKGRLALLAEEMNITIPGTQQFTSIDDLYRALPEIEFPVFLKVREGASGVGLKKCDTPEDLTSTFRKFVDGYNLQPDEYPLVQQFVQGEDYCCTMLFNRGKKVASMTYHNVRAFPRQTGAGALRETVAMPEADDAAEKILERLDWHGMAEIDFRKADDGPAYLIEINPRFFGGLPQAIAANVDYPHLLFQIASGQTIDASPDVNYDARTEAPIVGLLATLDEIAHDDRVLDRLRNVRQELGAVGHSNVEDVRLKPLWNAIKQAANPSDIKGYLREMFAMHDGTINDVLQSDDPRPAMGMLFPLALMLKHGKLSMGVLTSEADIDADRPRRRFRDMLMQPTWRVLLVTAALYALSVFTTHYEPTSGNLGLLFGWPENFFGRLDSGTSGSVFGAIRHTISQSLILLTWYVVAAIVLRERPPAENKTGE
ncbi:MAG: ATP-grasp domain-containing protein [Planctomycetaceae bacterium]|jgi:predicted ATP-grasp superfamily ATP-dependent carboligase|nr:ATP-grasp domain-containing protein [Planctomycetaceae bacterium]MBT6157207.1 ATP-grasp domain-containing protein [Planctomycetaceae bacterium]MBT6485925.1 ATP-grasp domain-containing protein [Planctomycetaceae bacterium]MBT6497184.1 ATP-grasp domain-containing protein [Planctomycetaceae bacterium]